MSDASSYVSFDDYDYQPKVNEVLISECRSQKYLVNKFLGCGAFGNVVSCDDLQRKTSVAIKVEKQSRTTDAVRELHILSKIQSHDNGKENLIQLVDWFVYKERLCLVMEKMEVSLKHHFINAAEDGRYLILAEIRRIIYDVLVGLVYLKEMNIIHADIKPDNIMLRSCEKTGALRAKIIDFGLAHILKEQDSNPLVQTLYYRSPEVMMHCLPYSEKIDIWSVGCVLGELLGGCIMYLGKCEYDQLRYILENQGLPPEEMMMNGKRSHLFFEVCKTTKKIKLKTPSNFYLTVRHDDREDIFTEKVLYHRHSPYKLNEISKVSMPKEFYQLDDFMVESAYRHEASHLLQAMLELDPNQRISAREAIDHPFFQLIGQTQDSCKLIEEKHIWIKSHQ